MRALGFLAGLGALAAAWFGLRRAPQAVPDAVPADAPMPGAVEEAAPVTPPPVPAPLRPVPDRLSPADVVALAPQADPEGWLSLPELLAFVQVESSFRPAAYRFEPQLGEASYGLMQVLESSARDRGLSGDPRQMFDPLVGLRMGVLHARWGRDFLRRRLGREPSTAEWVGAYNAGVGNVLRGYVPLAYVQRWDAARRGFTA